MTTRNPHRWLVSLIGAAALGAAALFPFTGRADGPQVTVHKTPWCGCCTDWVEHLEDHGFEVTVHEHEDLTPVRERLGIPLSLGSCHSAETGGYAIEGHVPAADIQRLLSERPSGVRGLSVPGMPLGSPGMEVEGREDSAYDVISFGEDGESVYNQYRP